MCLNPSKINFQTLTSRFFQKSFECEFNFTIRHVNFPYAALNLSRQVNNLNYSIIFYTYKIFLFKNSDIFLYYLTIILIYKVTVGNLHFPDPEFS